MSAKPIPDDYDALVPYFVVRGAAQAIKSTHTKDVSPDEMAKGATEWAKQQKAG